MCWLSAYFFVFFSLPASSKRKDRHRLLYTFLTLFKRAVESADDLWKVFPAFFGRPHPFDKIYHGDVLLKNPRTATLRALSELTRSITIRWPDQFPWSWKLIALTTTGIRIRMDYSVHREIRLTSLVWGPHCERCSWMECWTSISWLNPRRTLLFVIRTKSSKLCDTSSCSWPCDFPCSW